MNNAKIGAAVLGGYLLGRTKKGKLALSLGAAMAGSRMRPGQVGKLLQDSPVLGNVSKQVRGELASAGKAAATTVLSAKAESLADALHERTAGLKERAHGEGGRGRHEEARDEEDADEEGDRDGGGRDEGGRDGGGRDDGSRRERRSGAGQEPGRRSEGREKKAKSGSARSRRPDDG
ncbi:ABC transporter substrate-binding protein [Streptomyces sp. Ru72]|uniref:ABC transporter substrate-binding protein n=1 Tax=Streptomyces sp. Ru72 TaxID=2080747 RepID=UPI0015E2B183|nr:ABC transporter substrate-binding protein [Streptomyces sp. Ru72]